MATMAQAIRSYLEATEGQVTAEQIRDHINSHYPDRWAESNLKAELYACAVNKPKAYVHHPYAKKFLYKHNDGTYELYSEQLHGPNEWVPDISDDETGGVAELAETTISLERDIEDHLVHHLETIEEGLKLVGRQVRTDVGRVDILAEDGDGRQVIIEVKVGEAKDSSIGQIARYLGWYSKTGQKPARGILIASTFPEGVQYGAAAVSNLRLMAYRMHFAFEHVEA